jgi:hypothetical protein
VNFFFASLCRRQRIRLSTRKAVLFIDIFFCFISTLSRGITAHYCTSLWWHLVTGCGWQIFIENNSYLYTNLFSSILTANSSTMTHLTKHWNKHKRFHYSFFHFVWKQNKHQVCGITSGQTWVYFPFSLNLLSAIIGQRLWPIKFWKYMHKRDQCQWMKFGYARARVCVCVCARARAVTWLIRKFEFIHSVIINSIRFCV